MDENELNQKIDNLQSTHKHYLSRIEELESLPDTRARRKQLIKLNEKKFKAFHKMRFVVMRAVEAGYEQDWKSGRWHKCQKNQN